MELWESLEQTLNELNEALSSLSTKGVEYCESNRAYQIAKSQKILKLKKEGMPVTLIPQMVKGTDEVHDLEFNRNYADVMYKAAQETINVKKIELKVIEKQIEREYGNAD